jgi:hypothetical protein
MSGLNLNEISFFTITCFILEGNWGVYMKSAVLWITQHKVV